MGILYLMISLKWDSDEYCLGGMLVSFYLHDLISCFQLCCKILMAMANLGGVDGILNFFNFHLLGIEK